MTRKNQFQSGEEDASCKYRLSHESSKVSLIADCMECKGRAQLSDRRCLSGILNGLSQEYNVDSVILSRYIETKYTEDSMEMLKMMVGILQDLDQMGIREPFDEYFSNDERLSSNLKGQLRSQCTKCALTPERIFSSLKREFLGGISRFYDELGKVTNQVAGNHERACAQCMKATKGDLVYLFNKLEKLRGFVIYKGFQIVI
ncbi:MAG: hypothetical protein JSW28_01185 [Thermoplasmata archaeon]|nr:MAG: hypothetical protein JSW28_01185 [Thermoplasmata archaeon]